MSSIRKPVRLMILDSPRDWSDFQARLSYEPNSHISINVDRSALVKRTRRVSLLVTEGVVRALCVVSRLRRSGDFEMLVCVEHVRPLHNAMNWDSLVDALPDGKRATITAARERISGVPPQTSQMIVEVLTRANPDLAQVVDELRVLARGTRGPVADTQAMVREQRDAVALGLEMTGIDSRAALGVEEPTGSVPFLTELGSSTTSEASILRHDASHFDNWIPRDAQHYDVWRYVDPEDPGRRVTVLYADKEALERLTGTDLIYFREDNPCFVLVQYKRMKRENGKDVYRPDQQLHDELARMDALSIQQSEFADLADWRLSTEPFYIKLVDPDVVRPEGNRLSRGLYFPVSMFRLLMQAGTSLGSGGAVAIGRHNAARYLTNGEFLTLMKQTLIGTSGDATTQLSHLIRESLNNGKGVVVAVDETDSSEARPLRHD